MHISLVAHDNKKNTLIEWAVRHREILKPHTLYGTGTTGGRLEEQGFIVKKFLSGPLGGDQEIGALIANGKMDVLFFIVDPLMSQPHEPDISALRRICDVHSIPIATNLATAECIITSQLFR